MTRASSPRRPLGVTPASRQTCALRREPSGSCQARCVGPVESVVALEGVAADGEVWTLLYAPEGERGHRHHLALLVNGGERESVSGFDIPGTTELGFGGGLTPGQGHLYLFGLTTARIVTVRAETRAEARWSEGATVALAEARSLDVDALRVFVIVRPAVEDVTALVGLDANGHEVQRIWLIGPPGQG